MLGLLLCSCTQPRYLFDVKFIQYNAHGMDEEEPGIDWGGLYREFMNTVVDDLFDPETLTLMMHVPDHVRHEGPYLV